MKNQPSMQRKRFSFFVIDRKGIIISHFKAFIIFVLLIKKHVHVRSFGSFDCSVVQHHHHTTSQHPYQMNILFFFSSMVFNHNQCEEKATRNGKATKTGRPKQNETKIISVILKFSGSKKMFIILTSLFCINALEGWFWRGWSFLNRSQGHLPFIFIPRSTS